MKTKFFVSLMVLAFLLTSCGNTRKKDPSGNDTNSKTVVTQAPTAENTTAAVKKYPVKSGIITYTNEGMGIKQKIVLYFDDYGMKEAEETYNDETTLNESALCDGTKRYTIIYKDKIAWDAGTCYRGIAYKFDWDEISKADKEYKVKKLPNRTVAGKDCEAYTLQSGDFPTIFAGWNNLLLFQETHTKYGNIIKTATNVEVDIAIPADKLSVPKGFEIKKSSM